jgi:lipopolysaccharide/colanic/teichoic acid biosynthesis glycosyltransferase
MMDLFYLKNMSVLLDLKIMLKTSAVIARQLLESQRRHDKWIAIDTRVNE